MREAFGYTFQESSKTLSERVVELCEDMGLEEVSSDEDGADYRFDNDDGGRGIVSIDLEADRICVDRDGEESQEFSGEDSDTLQKVRNALL